ncbi:uncharacterized protein PHACADRAFT_210586 [Phanerochaete carnosa HHB-10118-sp]|uniref:non-specific serine/threonine protein kinase n=1 Tax=Phanerochaete carnosa (strain HHB-10118-sp) TaxID=650164 RepID=K5UXK9_PHACS|nr:uncharacterized protein PHACADRAFT_210586 [Phanerochaete carnosa HHB-10118-sp]EKM54806.1 hypothetical protein PHACADRAFT_210586 [Phanerochaete carnosa HHB-10118-sp]
MMMDILSLTAAFIPYLTLVSLSLVPSNLAANILAFLGCKIAFEPLPDYYPARRHEKLEKRYRVATKLGAGVWSSTWLVSDTAASEGTERFYAVKILTLDATSQHRANVMPEVEAMKTIRDVGPTQHLPTLIDDFEIPLSRKHSHLCLVTDVYGQDVAAFRRSAPRKALPVHTVKVIVKQVLQALGHLHKLGIIHRDIRPDNIFLRTEMSPEAIDHWLKTLPEDQDDNSYPLPPDFKWDDPLERVKNMRIALTGLGQPQCTGRFGKQPAEQFRAYSQRAPEVVLGSDFGTSIDIWAIGCITFEMLIGRWLFHPEGGGGDFSLEDDHLAKMMELTGEHFSPTMLQRAELASTYFDSNGDLLRVPELYYVLLEDVLATYKTLPEDEIGLAASFIRDCIRLEPADRLSASALLSHPWLRLDVSPSLPHWAESLLSTFA